MNPKHTILFTVLAVIVFVSFPLLFFTNRNLAYYVYKEITYTTLINKLIGKVEKPIEKAIVLQDYFYDNLFTPVNSEVIDKDVYSDLIRGIAYCDQRSWGLGTFFGKAGIDNRLVMTKNPDGISNHTILEVFSDDKWVFLEPTYGLFIKNKKGEAISYMDICNNPSLFYLCPEMNMLKEINPSKYENVKRYFTKNIFYNNPREPAIWNNPVKGRDFKHKVITAILNFYIQIFGNHFAYLYQDVYLKNSSVLEQSEREYFKARNYDLYGRYQLAADSYKKIAFKYSKNQISEDALFFLGVLCNKIKNFESSIDIFQMLLKEYPDTKWKRIAHYYLGYSYELLKNYDLAKDYYLQGIGLCSEISQDDLRPIELKIVRRLYNLLHR